MTVLVPQPTTQVHSLIGANHTAAGEVSGDVLTALGATTFDFATPPVSSGAYPTPHGWDYTIYGTGSGSSQTFHARNEQTASVTNNGSMSTLIGDITTAVGANADALPVGCSIKLARPVGNNNTFRVDAPLKLGNLMWFIGNWSNTRLQAVGSAWGGTSTVPKAIIDADACDRVRIENCWIDGAGIAGVTGIFQLRNDSGSGHPNWGSGSSYSVIKANVVENFTVAGIQIGKEGVVGAGASSNAQVIENYVEGPGSGSYRSLAWYQSDAWIGPHNNIRAAGTNAYAVYIDASTVQMRGPGHVNLGGNPDNPHGGIHIAGGDHITIDGWYVDDIAGGSTIQGRGIYVNPTTESANGVSILNNFFNTTPGKITAGGFVNVIEFNNAAFACNDSQIVGNRVKPTAPGSGYKSFVRANAAGPFAGMVSVGNKCQSVVSLYSGGAPPAAQDVGNAG